MTRIVEENTAERLDRIDVRILTALQEDANLAVADLA